MRNGNIIVFSFGTLLGNATIYKTLAEAKASSSGTGSFEGIGYKKRTLGSDFKVYRPPYDGAVTASKATMTYYCTPKLEIVQTSTAATSGTVKALQAVLNAKFGAKLDVDGELGTQTVAAIKAAQKVVGVTQDGECGADTWSKIITH